MSRQKRERELHTDVIIILVDIFCNFVPVDADDDATFSLLIYSYFLFHQTIAFVNIADPNKSYNAFVWKIFFLPNIY